MASHFDLEIDAWAEENVNVRVLQRAVCEYLYLNFVTRTPVDTGQTKRKWHVEINTLSTVDEERDYVEELAKLAHLKNYDIVWISNSSRPILILENGGFVPPDPGPSKDPRPGRKGKILVQGGYSTQAPQGMVAISIEEVKALFP